MKTSFDRLSRPLRRRLLVAFLLCLSGLLLLSDAATTAPLEAGRTRLMSFNIRYGRADDGPDSWEHRRFQVRLSIRRSRPDIVALQECLEFQGAELEQAFRGYALAGVGRDDGEREGEMCAVLYRWSRFALLDQGHFWLSETPDVPGSKGWDAACPRIASWYRFADRYCEPDTFVVAVVHLDHVGVVARREGARLLKMRLRDVLEGEPLLMAGDFNAAGGPGGSEVWRLLVEDGRGGLPLRDTWEEAGPLAEMDGAGTFHGFTGVAGSDRIDWILASPEWEIEAAAIDREGRGGRWPSDHFPVTADFRLEWLPGVDALDAVTGATR